MKISDLYKLNQTIFENTKNQDWFHGSSHMIDEFNLDFLDSGNDALGSGIYFTDSFDLAQRFSEGMFVYRANIDTSKCIHKNFQLTEEIIRELILLAPDFEETLWNFADIGSFGLDYALDQAIKSYLPYKKDWLKGLSTFSNDFYPRHSKMSKQFLINFKKVTGKTCFKSAEQENTTILVVFDPSTIKIVEKIQI